MASWWILLQAVLSTILSLNMTTATRTSTSSWPLQPQLKVACCLLTSSFLSMTPSCAEKTFSSWPTSCATSISTGQVLLSHPLLACMPIKLLSTTRSLVHSREDNKHSLQLKKPGSDKSSLRKLSPSTRSSISCEQKESNFKLQKYTKGSILSLYSSCYK